MKIRMGFVSNSSSSSFMVPFDTIPTYEDLKKSLGVEKASVVFNDITSQYHIRLQPDSAFYNELVKKIKKEFEAGYLYEAENDPRLKSVGWNTSPNRNHYATEALYQVEYNKWCDKQSAIRSEVFGELADKWIQKHLGKFILFFEYSDNEGDLNAELEHGGTFNRWDGMQISHH